MSTIKTIQGAGGSKSGSGNTARVPVESADSLRSTSSAHVLDLLCEGEIVGLLEGEKSIYLDGTPLRSSDDAGTLNFTNVHIDDTSKGTQGQLPLEKFSSVETETAVEVEVTLATSVTRTITDANIDAARINIQFPNLSLQNTVNGDLTGTSVQIAIDVQSNSGGYVAQNIGFAWQTSTNPATLPAIALRITSEWAYPIVVVAGRGYTSMQNVAFDVQYRQVGAGSWITLQSEAQSSGERFTGRRLVREIYKRFTTYSVTGLPSLLYEARILLGSGAGTVGVKTFEILTASTYDTITGKATSPYQRAYRVSLPNGPGQGPPWDLRVRRLTPDSTTVSLQNKTVFSSYAEIVDQRLSYPNSALVGLEIDAEQFSTIPTRGYDVKLLKIQIPSNYNPISRVYTGTWDGTFVVAWSDNPAWCFYDLLRNTRYGLGNYLSASQIDKWGLYTIAQYCDGLVFDHEGHEEPRFTCNLYLQTQQEAYQVISDMASIFRGMAYWAAGALTAAQDAPVDPVSLFTEANVVNGEFSYAGSAKGTRHTVALVSWNDPEDGFKLKPEYVEDQTGISRYGVVTTSIVAVGCISKGQARRVGEWLLYSERQETEVVTFRCGQDGTYVRPGNIIAVQDQHRAGLRYGGRVVSSTASTITLDASITIAASVVYTIQVVLPDSTLATKTITNAVGSYTVLTISVNFVTQPTVNAVWVITSTALSPRLFRVISIVEVEKQAYEVSALEHNPSKFDYIERELPIVTPAYSSIGLVPPAPSNVALSESLVIYAGIVSVVVVVTWDRVTSATAYRVEYRRNSGNYVRLTDVRTTSAEIAPAQPGLYEVRVTAVNVLQAVSIAATASRQILGKTAAPANVTGFVVARTEDALNFSWQAVADLDLSHYELRQGLTWESGVIIGTTINTQMRITTNIGSTYLIKAVDQTGIFSLAATAIIIAANTNINVVVTANDAPGWVGVKVQTVASAAGVTLAGQNGWTDLPNPWSTYTATWNTVLPANVLFMNGTYETVPIDLTVAMTSRVEILPVVQQITATGTWAALTAAWSTYTTPWSGVPGIVSVTYEIAFSQDAVTYTAYQAYQSGHYVARAYKFRLTLRTSDTAYLPLVSSFLVTIDVPDRVVHYEDQATVSGGTTLTFSPQFVNVQTVTGTIQSGAIGDTFRVTSKTNSSAVVTVYDSAGVAKAGVVDIDVFGYGSI